MEGKQEQPIGKGVARPKGQRDVIRDLEVRLASAYRSQEEAGRMIARAEEGRAELRNTCGMLSLGVYESGAKAMGLHDALVALDGHVRRAARAHRWAGAAAIVACCIAGLWPWSFAVMLVIVTVAVHEVTRGVPAPILEATARALEGKAGEAIRSQLEATARALELAESATSNAIETVLRQNSAWGVGECRLTIGCDGNTAAPWFVQIPKWNITIRGANPREVLATAESVVGDLVRDETKPAGGPPERPVKPVPPTSETIRESDTKGSN